MIYDINYLTSLWLTSTGATFVYVILARLFGQEYLPKGYALFFPISAVFKVHFLYN